MGYLLKEGWGVAQSDEDAAKWMLKAAKQGMIEAQFNVGDFFFRGCGVVQSYVEAAKWFRQAAEQGHMGAQASWGAFL